MRLHYLVSVTTTAWLFVACATAPPAPNAAASAQATPDDDLNAVLWSQRAVEHDLVYREVFHAAEIGLRRALSDPDWDALPAGERTGRASGLPPAVIVDVDETMLDNSPYQAHLVRTGEEYNDSSWREWCRSEAAKALPGALEFARFADTNGVRIYYLTNRAADLGPATLANLHKAGFPVPDESVFLGLGVVVKGCQAIGSDKGCRRRLVGAGHRVLMQLGDQIGDFVDVLANTPTGREQAVAPYVAWVGERWFVLPNPAYGSWEPACFGNRWRLPRDVRRKAKIDCLTAY